MNILVIHEVSWTKKVVFEIHTLSELLSLRGHNVYALSYESMWQGFGLSKHKESVVARAYPDAKVNLIQPGFIKIPVLSRVSAFVTHYFAIKKAIQEHKIDVIILYSVPTNGLQALYLATKYDVPIIFRSIDTLHQLVRNPILSGMTLDMERVVYSGVGLTLAISKRLMQYVQKLGAKDVRLLPLGVDTNLYCPKPQSKALREKWGIGIDDRVIVFVGTLPHFSGLDGLIKEFPEILKRVPNAKLLIVGDGVQRSKLDLIIQETGLTGKAIITGYQPQSEIPDYINLADVCVSTFPICGATRDIFPTKIIQYMACGKPVVSTPLPGLMDEIPDMVNGVFYTDNLASKIVSLLIINDFRQRFSDRALEYVKQNFSYDTVINKWEDILEEVTSDRRKAIQ